VSAFLDTNILVYAQQTGPKAAISQDLRQGRHVLRKKKNRSWAEIERVLDDIDNALDPALPLTSKTSRAALGFACDHTLAFYDALIIASAIEAGCDTLFTMTRNESKHFDTCL